MALTDTGIKALKPAEKAFKAYDGKGLYLEIAKSGGKLWRYRYRHAGKEKLLALGAYPETSLAEARDKRNVAAKQVSAGKDPSHTRKMDKIAASISAGNTFADVAEDYIKTKMAYRAESTRTKAQWLLDNLAALHRRPIAEIVPAELLTVLRRIESSGRLDTAKATRAFASRVFLYGVATVRCEGNPAALLLGALSNPVVKHRAAILEPLALGAFLRAVNCYAGTPTVKLASLLGVAVTVANRPGAGGSLGTQSVIRAPKDGYTLLYAQNSPLTIRRVIHNEPLLAEPANHEVGDGRLVLD